jgi:protein-S-isoprenylcysteine O-methyltransferase Ste14
VSSNFRERGGWWVVGQSFLMLGAIVLGPVCRSVTAYPLLRAVGYLLILLGACFGVSGVVALKGNRTAFPKPRDQSQLIQQGIYSYVRHPLYTSVILVLCGWSALWGSSIAFGIALATAPFFYAKSRVEERWLRHKFPEYAQYERRVARFIPWVY